MTRKLLHFFFTVMALSVATADAESIQTFDKPLDSTWSSWTNDLSSDWRITGDCLLQGTANSDEEPWGDRYLIRKLGGSLLNGPGSSFEASVDMMLTDYRGGTGIWQGLGLFVDPQNPTNDGRVFVIVERADKDGISGLRVHSGDWMSGLVPVSTETLEWHRLSIRLGEEDSQIRLQVSLDPIGAESGDWDLDVILPLSVDSSFQTIALGTAAEYGFQVNPRVAFDNLAYSSDGPLSVLPAPASLGAELLQSRLYYILAEFDHHPDTRLEGKDRQRFLEEAARVLDMAEGVEDIPGVSAQRIARTKMRAKGGLEQWAALRATANHALQSGLQLNVESADAAVTSAKNLYGGLNDLRSKRPRAAADKLKAFMEDNPNSPETPEAHRLLCHALFELRDREEEYWDVTLDFIARDVQPDQVDDIMFNQAAFLEKKGRYTEERELLDHILREYPNTELFPLLIMGRMQSFIEERDIDGCLDHAALMTKNFGKGTLEYRVGRYYEGLTGFYQSPPDYARAKDRFDEIISSCAGRESELEASDLDLILNCLGWRMWIAKKERDENELALLTYQLEAFPAHPEKERLYRNYVLFPNGQQDLKPVSELMRAQR